MPAHDEARNHAPRTGAGLFWTYVGVVMAAGVGLLAAQLRLVRPHDLAGTGAALVVIAVLVVIGEVRPLVVAGFRDANGVNTSTAFTFALLLYMGLPVAAAMQAVGTFVADVSKRKAPWRTGFNVAQFTLSIAASDGVLRLFGRDATPVHRLSVDGHDLIAIAVAGAAYFLVNDILVSVALALHDHTSLRTAFLADFGFQVTSTCALLGLSPIIVIVIQHGPALVPLLLFPLAAVYATAAMTRQRDRASLHDPLTRLPNRLMLEAETAEALEQASSSSTHLALYLLDLDRFKEINDTLGHQAGDVLLQAVGARLAATLRPEDVVARLGGDEFAVLVPELDEPRRALDIAERVRAALAEPFEHDGISHEIEASIGIAMHPQHGNSFAALLQRADVAMYVAKENGTGIQVYSTEIDKHSTSRLSMVAELRKALSNSELELHFQPKADLRTADVVGLEALLRWRHPEHGLVPPDDFIPLAEQTGLMRTITRHVIDEALSQLALWWAEDMNVQVAVNVSARDLYDRGFAESLRQGLHAHEVPPRALMIEVTESVLMADPARAASTLTAVAALGVGVSLDDFGTGYSSLVHLKRLPVSEVKIDRSFVMRMDVNDDDAAIVRSIIDLAAALGLRTVAEGVETRSAWEQLAVFGCDAAQGWYLSKAMDADTATAWLREATGRRELHSRLEAVAAAGGGAGQLVAPVVANHEQPLHDRTMLA